MNRQFSLYLDAVRFGAALLVLLSHFAYPRFSNGDWAFIRALNLGSDAVVLFFVLSGFVIAFVAEQRDRIAATFFFNRATRLYSVLLPAMALTVVCDTIGRAAAPQMYDGMWWYNAEPLWRQVAAVISFTHEGWGSGVRFGTNGPLWSLGYEAWYYALFGRAVLPKRTAAHCFGYHNRRASRTPCVGIAARVVGRRDAVAAPLQRKDRFA